MNKSGLKLTYAFLFFLSISSCLKDYELETITGKPLPPEIITLETHEVFDLTTELEDGSFIDEPEPVFYSLEQNRLICPDLAQTELWNIKFE